MDFLAALIPEKWLIAVIIVGLALGGAYYQGRVDGKNSVSVPVLNDVVKEAKKDAQNWSNRPYGHDALVKRLRNAASKLGTNASGPR